MNKISNAMIVAAALTAFGTFAVNAADTQRHEDPRAAFVQTATPLNQQLMAKMTELKALYAAEPRDEAKIKAVTEELGQLQARLIGARMDMQSKMSGMNGMGGTMALGMCPMMDQGMNKSAGMGKMGGGMAGGKDMCARMKTAMSGKCMAGGTAGGMADGAAGGTGASNAMGTGMKADKGMNGDMAMNGKM